MAHFSTPVVGEGSMARSYCGIVMEYGEAEKQVGVDSISDRSSTRQYCVVDLDFQD